MVESNDKCNWKKVFKKFLEPQKLTENENVQRNNIEDFVSVGCCVDQEKSISESSLISCSPVSNDSGYSGCKFEFYGKLPAETHDTFEPNLNFPEASDCKLHFNSDTLWNPPLNHELDINFPKINNHKTEFYHNISLKKLPPSEFKRNTHQASGFKPEFDHKLPSKMLSHDISHVRSVTESKKTDNIHDKVPEWNKAFKNILRDNSSVMDAPQQTVTIYPSKETQKFKNSDTLGVTKQRKQSSYKPNRRYEKAEKYKDYEVSEEEKKVKEIFAKSRMFKLKQVNLNDFHGCGVDIFKKDQFSSTKSTYASSKLTDKPYLPLTGFIAKSKPYTAADVVASYVPFDEDAWDDDLLI